LTQQLHTGAKVARIWRGRVPSSRADEYQKYLYEAGIRPLQRTALAVEVLREDRDEETEFITISYWENVEAMSKFAGPDARRIHHLNRDPEFLIEMPRSVQILEIIHTACLPVR
jgi:heme-degrading monooxygenase HmoA